MAFDINTAQEITLTRRQGGGFDISTAKPIEEEPVSGGLRRAALQGATFGAGDELAAALTAGAYKAGEAVGILPESGESISEIYESQAGRERETLKKYREQEPGKAFAAELAGGLLTGGSGAAKLAGLKGVQALSPLKQAAVIGGTEGAIYGGLSGDPGERLGSAAMGGLGGAIGAPALQFAGRIGARLAAPIARRIRDAILGDPVTDARNFLAHGLVREGVESVEDLSPTARGSEMATLADVSQAARGMLEGLVTDTESREIRKLATQALGKRNRENQARLFDLIDDDLGTVGRSFSQTIKQLRQSRADAAEPLYTAAREKPLKMTNYMQVVMDPEKGVPEVVDAVKTANRRLATKRAAGDQVSNIDVIDETKRVIDDQIGSLYRQGANNRARDIIRVKNKILEDVDQQIPEYKAARNVFAGDSALMDAADLGTQILRKDVDYLDDMLRTMSDSEKGMFRIGAKKAIREKLMQAREGTNAINRIASEINLDRMKRAFPSERSFNQFRDDLRFEANIFETERVLHNSMTALRQAERRALSQGVDFSMPSDFGNDIYSMAAKGIQRIMNKSLSPEAKVSLGRLILTPINELPGNTTQRITRTIQNSLPEGDRDLFMQMVEAAQSAATAGSITAPAIAPSIAGQ